MAEAGRWQRAGLCLLCGQVSVVGMMLAVLPAAGLAGDGRWRELLAWIVLVGLAVGLAASWCRRREASHILRLIRVENRCLTVGQAPEGGLIAWLCEGAWLRPRAIPIEAIQALRLTPGYLAVYLKPSAAAVDVFFPARDTAQVGARLAPLAHLFVDEVPHP
ncbi:MAG: hypothetical protein RMK60_02510 [Burkholderiales bacterium]|nr:hypothetical protein [Burkholderiales bacterium]